MRVRSSGSVRIISLDLEKTLARLRKAAQTLKKQDENVLEVLLFGSLATEHAVPGSDADILIVLAKSEKSVIDRMADFMDAFSGLGIPVDVFPYTKTELEQMEQTENLFAREMLTRSLKLA